MRNKERILIPKGAEVVVCRQRIVSAKWITRTGQIVVIPMIGGIDREPATKDHDRHIRFTQLTSRKHKLLSMGGSLNERDERELGMLYK